MKNIIFVFALLLIAATKINAQTLKVTNNTTCNIWYDFYSYNSTCTIPGAGTGGTVIGASTTNTHTSTQPWRYGRVGDDNSVCNFVAGGGGCSRNFYLTISDGGCITGVTSGCFNADNVTPGCNTCGNATINVTTTYYINGDLDVDFN